MTILSLKEKNDNLVTVPTDLVALVAPWGTAIPPKITIDPNGTLAAFPGFKSLGELQKKGGAGLAPDIKTSDIEGYGSLPARRKVKTGEGLSMDLAIQESRKIAYEMFFGMDLSGVTADANGEWRAVKSSQGGIRYFTVILIAQDGSAGNETYPFFILPKVSVEKTDKMQFQMDSEIPFGVTVAALDDANFGGYIGFGVCGKGAQATYADAGFATPATSITVAPTTATLAVGATRQLTVTDNNSQNRTAAATYVSATPARATVSATGLVTAVSAGSSVITATLGALTSTSTITVS